jgi:putative hydrolase
MKFEYLDNLFKTMYNQISKKNIPAVDLHLHTSWTDGQNNVSEIFQEANKKKLNYIFFSEHSRKCSGDWFLKFKKEVEDSNVKSKCHGIVGTEVKILNYHGDLDINDMIYDNSDLVMASVHRFPNEKDDEVKNKSKIDPTEAIKIEYELSMAVSSNKKFDILGHPFGMSLKRFRVFPDLKLFEDIIIKLSKNNKIFELNCAYHNNFYLKQLLNLCLKHNCLISIGSNAHDLESIAIIQKRLNEI